MSAPISVLNKVKLLLNLASSSNQNEADNARTLANKLISKYNITEEELSSLEEKVFYGENEKLFVTIGIVGWRQQLALCVARYFDCQIVQEELVPAEGLHQYNYFVYGDDDQVKDTQFVYNAFAEKVEDLIVVNCFKRGAIYIDSYCEGVVESIKGNIQMFGIDIPDIKKTLKPEQQATPPSSKSITKSGPNKEEPTDNRVDISGQSFIKDVMAYFKGLEDGKDLSLSDVLKIASDSLKVPELDNSNKEI